MRHFERAYGTSYCRTDYPLAERIDFCVPPSLQERSLCDADLVRQSTRVDNKSMLSFLGGRPILTASAFGHCRDIRSRPSTPELCRKRETFTTTVPESNRLTGCKPGVSKRDPVRLCPKLRLQVTSPGRDRGETLRFRKGVYGPATA